MKTNDLLQRVLDALAHETAANAETEQQNKEREQAAVDRARQYERDRILLERLHESIFHD